MLNRAVLKFDAVSDTPQFSQVASCPEIIFALVPGPQKVCCGSMARFWRAVPEPPEEREFVHLSDCGVVAIMRRMPNSRRERKDSMPFRFTLVYIAGAQYPGEFRV